LADVDRLDEESQKTLRFQLASLAHLMANAQYQMARQAGDNDKAVLRDRARSWNDLACELRPQLRPLAAYQNRKFSRKLDDVAENDAAIANLPGDADLDLRAIWAAESGDAALWRELTQQQLDQQPTNVTHWFNLALANVRLGELDAAAASFDVSNRLQPRILATLLNRGICNLDRGEPRLAFDDFSACLQLEPRMMVPRFNRALASHQLGNHREALEDLNELVRQGFATTRIVLMRGQVHDALGDQKAADADRRTALEIAPRDANDWVARGVSRLASSPKEALNDFKAALRLRPDDTNAIENAAHVYAERLGEPVPAIELLTRLISIRPNSPSAVASRGVLRARLGRTESAAADAHAAAALSPGAREKLQIAGIHALLSDKLDRDQHRENALIWLARALRTDVGLAPLARGDSDLASLRNDRRFSQLVGNAIKIDSLSTADANDD
jgi:tetratricopeptide (TPR) repeat protein